jgi:4-amino-4-deoxy-L-arabinose transferase-like glycosyltransferase
VSARESAAPPGSRPTARGDASARFASQIGLLAHPLQAHWRLLAVLAAFALAAVVVPTMTPVATTDDWSYARSAQILLAEGRLTIFPVVVATAIVPVAWGALFGLVLGPELGVFRLSTVAMTAIGAIALYGLCLDLGVSRPRSALGVASFLFNPLVFVLAFTFMTDPHFVALLVLATWLFARSIGPTAIDGRLLVAGSVVAGLAFLTRHQGALIAPLVVVFLLASRRLRRDRESVAAVARVVAIPILTVLGYLLWLRLQPADDAGMMQSTFVREIVAGGWDGTWWLLRWLTVFSLVYLGFFTLPLAAAVLPVDHALFRKMSRPGWIVFAVWSAVVTGGAAVMAGRGAFMPYVPQFFGPTGLGPPDLLGGRPELLGEAGRTALTIVVVLASLLLAAVAASALGAPPTMERSRAALVLGVAIGQAAGVLPPSYHFLGWSAGSVDRYLIPLAPLAIALALWALRGVPVVLPLGWLVVAVLALFSIAGTRDYLVFLDDVWAMGEDAVAAGVPLDRLDAGAGWDGYHLYERGLAHDVAPRTPHGPWWVYMNAPATDSAYVVASAPIPGYDAIEERASSAWLGEAPTLFLLRRQGEPGPP